MLSIAQGRPTYRTRLLETEPAFRFAKCLHNNPRFVEVEVHHSSRAKGPAHWFVSFRPASEERQDAMQQRQQDARTERAQAEGAGYVWALDTSSPRPFWWCLSTSGETYEVTPESCTCADHAYRCAPSGGALRCKHQIALTSGLGRQVSFSAPTTAPEPATTRRGATSDEPETQLPPLRTPPARTPHAARGDLHPSADLPALPGAVAGEDRAAPDGAARGMAALRGVCAVGGVLMGRRAAYGPRLPRWVVWERQHGGRRVVKVCYSEEFARRHAAENGLEVERFEGRIWHGQDLGQPMTVEAAERLEFRRAAMKRARG